MKKKIVFLFVVLVLLNILIYYGLPYLKQIKEKKTILPEKNIEESNQSLTGKRPVRVDISVESICKNMITDEIYAKCSNSTNCQKTCEAEGCKLFGLHYEGSEFSESHCYCNCLEENKIKKALTQQRP